MEVGNVREGILETERIFSSETLTEAEAAYLEQEKERLVSEASRFLKDGGEASDADA